MRQENKTELTARIPVQDAAGERRSVEEYTSFLRVQTLDGNWSNWQRNRVRYLCEGAPVNLLEDGNFDLVRTQGVLTRMTPPKAA